MIADAVRQPEYIAALRQTASGNRTWPDSCGIASNITSNCSAYKAKTFYMGSSDVASNKAALLQVLANESYKKGASLQVTNAEEPCLKVDLQAWTAICKEPWFKCVFKSIKSITHELRGNMGPLFAMIKSGSLPNLNELWLGGNQIGDDGMSAFVGVIASGSLGNLQKLYLPNNNIGDDGMKAFAEALAGLPSLKTLVLDKFAIRDDNDTSLDLSSKNLNDTDMKIIAHLFANGRGNLQILRLSGNRFGDVGMTELSRAIASGSLGNLEQLWLSYNQIGDAGISALAGAIASGSLGSLQTLFLHQNQIGDVGMIEFSRAIASGSLPALKTVVVDTEHKRQPQLVAACRAHWIRLLSGPLATTR